VALDLIQKLAYATCADHYNRLYDQLQTSVPATVLKYFDDNWHNIRAEWCLGLKFASSSFMNTTNNRLERLNGQLKEVIGRETFLEEFIDKLYIVLNSLRNEHDHRTALQFQKVPTVSHQRGSSEDLYSQLLTTYAADFVLKQLQLHSKVTPTVSDADDALFHVSSHEGNLTVTDSSCQCLFRKATGLPCRHIFAVRSRLGMNLFDAGLCLNRWFLRTCRVHQRLFDDNSEIPGSVHVSTAVTSQSTLSGHQKYRMASQQTSLLATLVSSVGTQEFHERMDVLRKLAQGWQTGSTMTVTSVSDIATDDVQSQTSEASASGDVVTDVVLSYTGGADIPHSAAVDTLVAHETISVDNDILDDPTDSSPAAATSAPPVQTTAIAGTCTSCITVLCLSAVLV